MTRLNLIQGRRGPILEMAQNLKNGSCPDPVLPLPTDREHLPALDGSGAGGFIHRVDERDVEHVTLPIGTARVYAMNEDDYMVIYFFDHRPWAWEDERNYAKAA